MSTIDPAEIAKFERLAQTWWDSAGPMKVLHRFNPVRLAFIRNESCRHFRRDASGPRPLEGLSLLDIGCGGGLLSEPLARIGAQVTGIDPAPTNIRVAALHAKTSGLSIDYRNDAIEAVALRGEAFDIVLAMEVVEHVADVEAFIGACCQAVKPGGLLYLATLNRTLRSYALAIVGAEYILGWLPKGTHDWNKFITPEELGAATQRHGLRTKDRKGVVYNPLSGQWSLSKDMAVNYMILASHNAEE